MSNPDDRHVSLPTAPVRNIAGPLRLIFWGMIICLFKIELGKFDIVNDFVGMSLILWGIVSLSRIRASVRYRWGMFFLVAFVTVATISSFFGAVLFPFHPEWMPRPNAVVFAAFFLAILISLGGLIVFGRCMAEYCTIMDWKKALASWKYSIRLISFGVFVPLCILCAPFCFFFGSLMFDRNNPRPISWETRYDGEEMHITARRDEKVIYSETFPKPQPGQSFTYPKLDSPSHDGATFDFGGWSVPVKGFLPWIVILATMPVVAVVYWAITHFLISLSRTIHASENRRNVGSPPG